MIDRLASCTVAVLSILPIGVAGAQPFTLGFFPPDQRDVQIDLEGRLTELASTDSLRRFHDRLSSEPHMAGTPGDARVVDTLAREMEAMGLEVEKHEIWVYLSHPVDASLEIVEPEPIALPIIERPLAEDPFTSHPDLTFGFNAYAATGDVTATVVYANFGTKEDFQTLRDLGVDCTGKIVIARYGRNYRGYKARFAEEAGAVGLIVFTDPADAGFTRGAVYPEGGWANETYIQRGSMKTLPYAGDALTPFIPATQDAPRLNPDDVALPRIPVQPVGYGAAAEILSRMDGPAVPEGWQGGLAFDYKLTGDNVKVRLAVEQKRDLVRTHNVLGYLRGSTHPEQLVIIGSHHDAWSFGAGDPNSGSIAVLEAARCFAQLAREGHPPRRTIVFAHWGAEEFGIIGSTEWVEANRDDLSANAVAYFNLDMASMGLDFGSSAAPALKDVIIDATRNVMQPYPAEPEPDAIEPDADAAAPAVAGSQSSVFIEWTSRAPNPVNPDEPNFGFLGGGSDHIGFYCHLAVPCASVGGSGAPGTSYHSNYETLAWYRQIVGDDYRSPLMVTQVVTLAAARLANAPVLPYNPERISVDGLEHLRSLSRRARELTLFASDGEAGELLPAFQPLSEALEEHQANARHVVDRLRKSLSDGGLSDESVAAINRHLIEMERVWINPAGIPGRPWFRNLFAATDEDSGYAAWPLPALRYCVERGNTDALSEWVDRYVERVDRLKEGLAEIESQLRP